MIRFGIIGAGWRSEFFLRIAAACPDQFEVTGVTTRNADRAQRLRDAFGVSVFSSVDEVIQQPNDFAVTSVPRSANPQVIAQLVEADLPVLSETPPAEGIDGMVELCKLTAKGAKIQVAEQYFLQPLHAARRALIATGKLGPISQAQVSVAHDYHGISLIRHFLGLTFEDATIRGQSFKANITNSPGRAGLPTEDKLVDEGQSLCTLDFGDRLGVYDFTGHQYFSYIRGQRVCIRGQRGEIIDQHATWLADLTTPIHASFHRHMAGPNGNLEGHYLKGIQCGEDWLYKNPLAPARLTDDEIAIGDLLLRMANYVNGGDPVYPLKHACQDHYLALMCAKAIETGQPVKTATQPWAD